MNWTHEAAELAAKAGDVQAHRWLGYQEGRATMLARAEKAETALADALCRVERLALRVGELERCEAEVAQLRARVAAMAASPLLQGWWCMACDFANDAENVLWCSKCAEPKPAPSGRRE